MNNLKYWILIFVFIFSSAQTIKTKDGVIIGQRNEFISLCSKIVDKKQIEINGFEINSDNYCACLSDALIPSLNYWEIEKATKENKMKELFLNEKNYNIFQKCFDKSNIKFKNDFRIEKLNNQTLKDIIIKSCVKGIMQTENSELLWTEDLAKKYCDCALNKMESEGQSFDALYKNGSFDENSTIFNEIAVPCFNEIFDINTRKLSYNSYNINDIKGESIRSTVPLIDYFGNGYKLKISISGVTKYFLLDTGASDLIIDRDTERELLLNGSLKKENYLNKTEYTLANNQVIKAQLVKVNNVTIGDYIVNNIVIAVVDDGSLLCGKSFLDKFKNWELDKKNKMLILHK